MAKAGRSLQDLAAEIERRAEAKRDLIAPVSRLSMEVADGAPVIAVTNGHLETFGVIDLPPQDWQRLAA